AARRLNTRCSPAIMSEVKASAQGEGKEKEEHVKELLIIVKIWTAMSLAPFATPENGATAPSCPFPTAIPATWVPWSQSGSTSHGRPDPSTNEDSTPPGHTLVAKLLGLLVEKHASSTTFPPRNGWVLSTPVSSTATTVPPPSKASPADPPGHTWPA